MYFSASSPKSPELRLSQLSSGAFSRYRFSFSEKSSLGSSRNRAAMAKTDSKNSRQSI